MYKKILILVFIFMQPLNVIAMEPITMDSRMKTYIYNPNEVFPVVLHYGYHSHIDFPKNEYTKSIVIGSPSDWDITSRGNRIFLQTYSKAAHTNMTVITNKRTYEFDLIAKGELNETDYDLAYAIKFYYPEEAQLVDSNDEMNDFVTLEISDLIKGKINTNYIYKGDREVTPIIAFNDQRFTYLKFKDSSCIPEIETIGLKGMKKNHKVKIFSYNGYIIINDIFAQIKLSYKKKSAIINNKSI